MKKEVKVEIPRKDRPELEVITNLEDREKVQRYMDNYDWVTDVSEKFNEKEYGKVCVICGEKATRYRHKGKYYCSSHKYMMENYSEIRGVNQKTPNQIIIEDDFAYILTRDRTGLIITAIFKIDIKNIVKVLNYKWCKDINGYCTSQSSSVLLHRLLLGVTKKTDFVDHISRDTTDNTLANLRVTTQKANAQNSAMPSTNTSGFIGVRIKENHLGKRYVPFLNVNLPNGERCKKLGVYDTMEEAIPVRLQAEFDLCEDGYAPNRHLFEQYGITKKSENILEKYSSKPPRYGVVGVGFDRFRNKYTAERTINGVKIIKKRFDTLNEAIVNLLQAEYDNEGMEAKQAHLFKEFGIID